MVKKVNKVSSMQTNALVVILDHSANLVRLALSSTTTLTLSANPAKTSLQAPSTLEWQLIPLSALTSVAQASTHMKSILSARMLLSSK